jgi:multidrug resistance efflux pump
VSGRTCRSGGIAAALGAAVLALAGAAGCTTETATAADGAVAPGDRLVSHTATFRRTLLLTGELEAVDSVKLTVPRTPVWRLPIRWLAEDGVQVVQGQRVLELDNTQFTGELAQKRLARLSAYNDLARKEADIAGTIADKEFALETARIVLEKARIQAAIPESLRPKREFQEDQLALARAEFEHEKAGKDLEVTRRASEAEMEELRVEYQRATDEIATAEKAIGELTLTAPRDGLLIVSESRDEGRKYQVGDNVWVGLTVMEIPDLSSMKVVAQLSDVDDGLVAVGMPARCTLDTYPDRAYTGTVTEVAPIAQEEDNQSLRRFFRVDVRLDESDPQRMRPGMSVKVEVLPAPLEDVLLVPRVALDLGAEPAEVLLADGSSAAVELGPCNTSSCVVETGLEPEVALREAR